MFKANFYLKVSKVANVSSLMIVNIWLYVIQHAKLDKFFENQWVETKHSKTRDCAKRP